MLCPYHSTRTHRKDFFRLSGEIADFLKIQLSVEQEIFRPGRK